MKIEGIGWAGVRTKKNDEMEVFCKDVLGLDLIPPAIGELPYIQAFSLPNGQTFEVVGEDYHDLQGWEGLKIEFTVDDVPAAKIEMEEKGVKFINPVEVYTRQDGSVIHWTNFIAPDGNIYGLFSLSDAPSQQS
jgi:hypothetical protein